MAVAQKAIGARKLTAFEMLTDVQGTGTTYETTPEKLSRLIELTITPIMATGELESDDSVEEEENIIVGYDVAITASQLTDGMRAFLLGHKIDTNGGLIINQSDVAPWIALAWEYELSQDGTGVPKYGKDLLYKGKFQPFEEKFATRKRGNIEYQTHSGVKARFIARESDGAVRYKIRPDNTGYDATVAGNWFTAVQEKAEPTP